MNNIHICEICLAVFTYRNVEYYNFLLVSDYMKGKCSYCEMSRLSFGMHDTFVCVCVCVCVWFKTNHIKLSITWQGYFATT